MGWFVSVRGGGREGGTCVLDGGRGGGGEREVHVCWRGDKCVFEGDSGCVCDA